MKVATIQRIGIYDSRKQFSATSVSPMRTVRQFELDYILSCTKDAVSHVDGEEFALMPGMLILRKPGQKSYSHLHFRCYCLYLTAEEGSPCYETLSKAPTFFPLINEKSYLPIFESLLHHLLKHGWDTENYFVSAKLLELLYLIQRDAGKAAAECPQFPKKKDTPCRRRSLIWRGFTAEIFRWRHSARTLDTLPIISRKYFPRWLEYLRKNIWRACASSRQNIFWHKMKNRFPRLLWIAAFLPNRIFRRFSKNTY